MAECWLTGDDLLGNLQVQRSNRGDFALCGASDLSSATAPSVRIKPGPSEALALSEQDCFELPESGWGRLTLVNSEPRSGAIRTDDGQVRELRGLKHRGQA